jgi:hypothetical protein
MSSLFHPQPFARFLLAGLALAVTGGLTAAKEPSQIQPMPQSHRQVARIDYHGWRDALVLGNGLVEVVVVPAVGRIMQFRFVGASDGPFWMNPAPAGQSAATTTGDWANFGGDKTWPAPQADWDRIAARGWPPPAAFDSRPMEAVIDGASVTLVSPVDTGYGIRVRRRIELAPDRPVMTVTTSFEKAAGQPLDAAVWIITQLKDPAAVYALRPDLGSSGRAYVNQGAGTPAGLHVADGWLSLTRDPSQNHKIGLRAATLVWVGEAELLRIDSALVPGGKYPDDGSSAEVYTNADPLAYVELELLGPLARLQVGDKIERVSTYTLVRRVEKDPETEIRRLLAAPADSP